MPSRIGNAWDVCCAYLNFFLASQMLLLGVITPPLLVVKTSVFANAMPAIPQNGVVAIMGYGFDVSCTFNANNRPLLNSDMTGFGFGEHHLRPLDGCHGYAFATFGIATW